MYRSLICYIVGPDILHSACMTLDFGLVLQAFAVSTQNKLPLKWLCLDIIHFSYSFVEKSPQGYSFWY